MGKKKNKKYVKLSWSILFALLISSIISYWYGSINSIRWLINWSPEVGGAIVITMIFTYFYQKGIFKKGGVQG